MKSSNEYIMYKFYKGEKENPYKEETRDHFFWFYESIFERDWNGNKVSDWYVFFKENGLGDKFLELTKDLKDTKDRVTYKKAVFKLWLKYLFTEKLKGMRQTYLA